MKLSEIGKIADKAMPEGNQTVMTEKERKEFTALKARLVKRLARESK